MINNFLWSWLVLFGYSSEEYDGPSMSLNLTRKKNKILHNTRWWHAKQSRLKLECMYELEHASKPGLLVVLPAGEAFKIRQYVQPTRSNSPTWTMTSWMCWRHNERRKRKQAEKSPHLRLALSHASAVFRIYWERRTKDEHGFGFRYKFCGFAVFWWIWIGFGFHNFWLTGFGLGFGFENFV